MVKNIMYGKEGKDNYYVQACCGEEHYGQQCSCKTITEGVGLITASVIARRFAQMYGVKVIEAK